MVLIGWLAALLLIGFAAAFVVHVVAQAIEGNTGTGRAKGTMRAPRNLNDVATATGNGVRGVVRDSKTVTNAVRRTDWRGAPAKVRTRTGNGIEAVRRNGRRLGERAGIVEHTVASGGPPEPSSPPVLRVVKPPADASPPSTAPPPAAPSPDERTTPTMPPTTNGTGATEDLFTAFQSLVNSALQGGIHEKARVIKAFAEAQDFMAGVTSSFSRSLAEPDQHYPPSIWEPLAQNASHLKSGALKAGESEAAVQALLAMPVGELAASSVQAPHHDELNKGA